ncbi:MAG: hypothetical protein PWR01_1988 [Clostridiales bacterium]|jgi:hypothetical protein|nr:hypothetical protein [Clostridiales bacterium]MDN5280915.1 hypothetical protein [Candidatus Ozemobacter sp.]
MTRKFAGKVILILAAVILLPMAAMALYIPNPEQIKVDGLVSFGEDGAAWLSWNGHEMLVTSGYMIGTDLRVVAVRHDSVVVYQPESRQYQVLIPDSALAWKDRNDVIWTQGMPIWKITRMVALAYRKDYICHSTTTTQNIVRRHVRNMPSMMELVVSPNHRYYGKDGIIYVSPVHIQGTGWKHLMDRIQKYRSRTLGEWFPVLDEKSTIISDGRPLDQILQKIAFRTGVAIHWDRPTMVPLYCSLRDRPWHEILENIVVFNGFELIPTQKGLVIR